MPTEIFFSCSFRAEDEALNAFIRALCSGLGFVPVNVNTASPNVPPEEALRLITRCAALIAVATRREPVADGEFLMPRAVQDEISMAFAVRRPVLLLCEAGVRLDGFSPSYGTFLRFERERTNDPDLVNKIVAGLSALKDSLSGSSEPVESSRGYRCENTQVLVALEETVAGYEWLSAVTKRIRFDTHFAGTFLCRAWGDADLVPTTAAPIKWEISFDDGSRDFVLETQITRLTADEFDAVVRVTPEPDKEEFIEYSCTLRSPYLSPIFRNERSRTVVRIRGRDFCAKDGIVPIEQMINLHQQWRFPSSYKLRAQDIEPFVASHSYGVDYLVETELQRAVVEKRSFAGNLVITMTIDNPLLRHMYGIAWQPPLAPNSSA